MVALGVNYFGMMDYILLGATLLISLLIGLYYGYKGKQTNEELLVGGRNMSILPVAASVMVTYVSAITILGFPSEVYQNGGSIMVLHLVSAVGIPISAMVFVPFFYPMKLTSINEYLEKRYDSVWIRWLASGIFILQSVLLSGVVLYAPSLALEAFLGFPMWLSVLGIGLCASIYTNIGGLKAVVLTDFFQFLMMLCGLLSIVWKGISASGGFLNAMQLARDRGRMNFFDFTFDPFARHNFFNFLLGTGFHAFMQPGIHQLQVQRYSGMPTCSKAKQAIFVSVPLKLITMSLCLLTGFAIFAFYANCDPLANKEIGKIDQIVPFFVVNELSNIPGMIGIFTSCIFSAVLSSISSLCNSLACVAWEDFLVRIQYFRVMSPRAQTNVSRVSGAIFGIICMALAFIAKNLGAIYTATFAVIGATAGALYGVFLMALFLPFVNAVGAIIGALCGLITLIALSMVAFINKSSSSSNVALPTSTEQCPILNVTSITTTTTAATLSAPLISSVSFDEWPWKIFSLSYLLYPVVGAIVTIVVGILVSLLASICSSNYRKRPPAPKYVHPFVRTLFRCCLAEEIESQEDSCWAQNTEHIYNRRNGGNNNGIPLSPIVIDTSAAYIQPKRESQGRINMGYVPPAY